MNKKLHDWGVTLSCLGGLVMIVNTTWESDQWNLVFSIVAVVLALLGLFIINKAKRADTND